MTYVDLDKLKNLRKEHQMSQNDMAYVIRSRTVYPYHRKESGSQKFSADEIWDIANYFNKPLEYFFKN